MDSMEFLLFLVCFYVSESLLDIDLKFLLEYSCMMWGEVLVKIGNEMINSFI